jgi:hypothetical protein
MPGSINANRNYQNGWDSYELVEAMLVLIDLPHKTSES